MHEQITFQADLTQNLLQGQTPDASAFGSL